MNNEIGSVVKGLLVAATYAGLVLGTWALPVSAAMRLCVLGILILTGALVVVAERWIVASRHLKEMRSENERLVLLQSDADQALELTDGMVALAYCLSQPPISDKENHYYDVEQSYRIDNSDATYHYVLRGVRVADGESSTLTMKISGDAPVDASSLNLDAKDLETGESLRVTFIRDDPYFKVIQIALAQPLTMGQRFKISVAVRWGGTFPRARRNDYLFCQWGQYAAGGIDRLVCNLSADVEVRGVSLEEIALGRRRRSAVQPRTISQRGRCEVSWTVENPTALYLLRFEKVTA